MTRDKLNIVIPIYNPQAGWEKNFTDSLLGLEKELEATDFLVILINDGSSKPIDHIERIMDQLKNLRYYAYPVNQGKGYAIRYGINMADADFYIYTDMDFPFGYEVVIQTYLMLKSTKTNLVIGTRDASYFNLLPHKRRIISSLMKKLSYLTTGFKIEDTQAGLKGLDNMAKKILADTKINSFLFELEFLKKSLEQGLSYKFINVSPRPGIRFTNFRLKIIHKEVISFLKIFF